MNPSAYLRAAPLGKATGVDAPERVSHGGCTTTVGYKSGVPAMYEILFHPEAVARKFAGSRGNYYEFEDGSRLEMRTRPVWCRQCLDIGHGEDLETLNEIDAALAALRTPRPDPVLVMAWGRPFRFGSEADAHAFHHRLLDDAERRRKWRTARRCAAKCVACGSSEIVFLPAGQPIPHPSSDGTITLRCVGMCSTSFMNRFFTAEGDRIPRDAAPTYWQHPAAGDLNKPAGFSRWLRSRKT